MKNSPNRSSTQSSGGCACGKIRYAISGTPLFRAYCHCETCQTYNQADYADIIVMHSRDVALDGESHINFEFHQSLPVINRGTCSLCNGVAIEKILLPLSPKLIVIPAQTLGSILLAPEHVLHMFYHRRVREIEDTLPKYSGYFRSQWAFTTAVFMGLLRTRIAA